MPRTVGHPMNFGMRFSTVLGNLAVIGFLRIHGQPRVVLYTVLRRPAAALSTVNWRK